MNARLFAVLAETGGLDIPLLPDRGWPNSACEAPATAPRISPRRWWRNLNRASVFGLQ